MPISDPVAVQFVNAQITPLSESVRALHARLVAMRIDWNGGVNALIPNTADLLDGGQNRRELFSLTGAQITNAVSNLFTILTALEQPGVMEVLSRPCANPLNAS